MSKTVIVSGGMLEEQFVEEVMKNNEGACIIGVDRGVEYLYRHQLIPQYIVGDFDSIDPKVIAYYREQTNVPIREYHPIKDASDTEIALRLGITLRSSEILILGATGGRMDHMWANVQTLSIACSAGIPAYILDAQNKIRVIDGSCKIKKEEAYGSFLSVFSLTGEIYDFSLKGTKWPLSHYTLKPCDSLTVSNKFEEEEVEITFQNGMVIIMETRD